MITRDIPDEHMYILCEHIFSSLYLLFYVESPDTGIGENKMMYIYRKVIAPC